MAKCSICSHPEALLITESLARIGTRKTARRFSLSRSALDRHKQHLLTGNGTTPSSRETTRPISHRQAKLVEGIVEGKTLKHAAVEAGYSAATDNHGATLSSEQLREVFVGLLPRVDRIAERIAQGLNATKTKFAKVDGKITDQIECVDFAERRKYCELAARLSGLVPESKGSIVQVGVAVNVGRSQRPDEADLDLELARFVCEETSGFDPIEIARLKKLLDGERPAIN